MKQKLLHFNELVMMIHSIFSLPFIFIAMIVASHGWFGFKLLFLGVLAAFTARNFAMSFNRYIDRHIDILHERTKNRPSVDGRIKEKEMLIFIFINVVIFIITTYFVNHLAFMLSLPILFVLAIYPFFKRFSQTAHLILGFSLALAPIAGTIAVLQTVPLWSLMLAIGVMFWVAGFDILYSLQDIDFDKKMKLFSIPSKWGAKRSLLIAEVFHIFTIIFWILFVIYAELDLFAFLAIIFSALMLFYEHLLVRKDFKHINRAFFTVNAYLGIIFLIFIILDVMF